MLLRREASRRASEFSSSQWPTTCNLPITAWSALTVGELEDTLRTRDDAGHQTLHTDVHRLPSMLPRRSDPPTHLNMMIMISDKYHVEMRVRSQLGEHDGLVRPTIVCARVHMLLFASIMRHRGVPALPGVGKQVVLFRFLMPNERHPPVAR